MKTLYLLRHAKASWKDGELRDVERPLKEKGRLQADAMSDHLSPLLPPPREVLCSPAVRTRQTLDYFLEVWPMKRDRILMPDDLYLAEAEVLLNRIGTLDTSLDVVMLVGHNPGLTDLARILVSGEEKYVKSIKTCGFLQIDFDVDSWDGIGPGAGDIKLDLRPKDLRP